MKVNIDCGRQHLAALLLRNAPKPDVVEDPIHVRKLLAREPGDPLFDQGRNSRGPHRDSDRSKSMMNEHGKSDNPRVLKRSLNKATHNVAAERPEESGLTKRNKVRQNTRQALAEQN